MARHRHTGVVDMRLVVLFFLSLAVVTTTNHGVLAQQKGPNDPRFALVIGNAEYPDNRTPLRDAVNDARRMAEDLRRYSFDVDLRENLEKNAMQQALDRLNEKIVPGSVALVFFSGYGIQSERESYLIPVDAQIWSDTDVQRDGFSIEKILRGLNAKGARVKIVLLNASRRNPFERRFRSVPKGLAPPVTPRNTMIMYAAAPGTTSDLAADKESLFVTELIKHMRTEELPSEDVFTRTRFSVARASQNQQTPWFSSSLTERFYFSPDAASDSKREITAIPSSKPDSAIAKSSAPLPKTKPPGTEAAKTEVAKTEAPKTEAPNTAAHPKTESTPKQASDPEAEERRHYLRAEKNGTRQGWNDFLDEHPDGHYAMLAKNKLAALNSPPVAPKPPETSNPVPEQKESELDQEIRGLDRQLAGNPRDVVARYKRGTLHARNGNFVLAIKDLDEVIRARPKNADALNNRCWARAMLNRLQLALIDCNEAIRLRPRFANAFDSRGLIKLKIGRPKDAVADYDASLKINGRQASSLYGRGIAKIRSGNTSGGNDDIAAAKSIDPGIASEFASYGIK
jgi:uncharacterized caspase-like protein